MLPGTNTLIVEARDDVDNDGAYFVLLCFFFLSFFLSLSLFFFSRATDQIITNLHFYVYARENEHSLLVYANK